MSSPTRSSVSATSAGGQGASLGGGSTSNTGFGDDNSSYHFPIDLITAQDRKEEALKFLEQELLTALQEEVKLMDEDKWKYAGPRSQMHLISRPSVWVVKNPHLSIVSDTNKQCTTHLPPDPDLDLLLPKGFLDRTKDRGLVVKSWVRQITVLRHEAVGCFVTHLGWNSVLEAIGAGVRMIGWPMYAEQKLNKLFMVDNMKLAIAMEGYDKELVTAAEVERTVRKMMMVESEDVVGVKERSSATKHAAELTLADGGDSMLALDELVRAWRSQMSEQIKLN